MKTTIAIISTVLALSACGKKEVSFDTLETARTQARENAILNAQTFRRTDPRFDGLDIVARGDSTQMPDCPQGDGWASIDFFNKQTGVRIPAKCSTVSLAIGCMTDEDFKNKVYASEDGHCQNTNKVPFPFRKLVQ